MVGASTKFDHTLQIKCERKAEVLTDDQDSQVVEEVIHNTEENSSHVMMIVPDDNVKATERVMHIYDDNPSDTSSSEQVI